MNKVYLDYSALFDELKLSETGEISIDVLSDIIDSYDIKAYTSKAVALDIRIHNTITNTQNIISYSKLNMLDITESVRELAYELYAIDSNLTYCTPISMCLHIALCAINNMDIIVSNSMPVFISHQYRFDIASVLKKHNLNLPLIFSLDTVVRFFKQEELIYSYISSLKDTLFNNDSAPHITYINEAILCNDYEWAEVFENNLYYDEYSFIGLLDNLEDDEIDVSEYAHIINNVVDEYMCDGVDLVELKKEAVKGLLTAHDVYESSFNVPFDDFAKLFVENNVKNSKNNQLAKSHSDRIDLILSTLTPREEKVLRLRFGIGEKSDHTLEEVGQDFEVTRERIRQIEEKALRKVRHPSRRSRSINQN